MRASSTPHQSRLRVLRSPVVVAALAVVLVGATPASAKPGTTVACGSVITQDTRLAADVVGCVGTGLVIGASGITLDLNGHTVSGDGVEDPDEIGISVPGADHVRIVGGTVDGFYRGIVFDGSPDARVTSMTVRHSTRRGIVLLGGSDNGEVRHDDTSDNGASGIAIVDSDDATVMQDRSMRNIGGAGVLLRDANHSVVAHNELVADTLGVQVDEGSSQNRIADNDLSDAEDLALEMDFSDGNVMTGNVATRTSGISLESSDDNVMTDNRMYALAPPDGIGIQVYGNRNLVAHNDVVDPVRYGIEVDDFQDEGHTPATDNVVRDNRVVGGGLGIAIGPEAGGVVLRTLVQGNRVSRAVGDGIQLLGPSTGLETTVVRRNVADDNGGHGIAAVPGTVDGGGNRAAGNGNPQQCVNVSCR